MNKAPYTFIPIRKQILTVEDPDHSLPEAGNVSGTMTVHLHNDTPLLVGGAGGLNNAPSKVGEKLVIPGSSLRGMLRSVIETAAFGRVSFTDKHPSAVRDFGSQSWKNALGDALKDGQRRRGGWLFKERKGDQSVYYLVKAENEFSKSVSLDTLIKKLGLGQKAEWHAASVHERYHMLRVADLNGLKNLPTFDIDGRDQQKGQLFVSGVTAGDARDWNKPKAKNREHAFIWPENPIREELPPALVENFLGSLERDPEAAEAPKTNFSALTRTGPTTGFGQGSIREQLLDPARHGLPVFYAPRSRNSGDYALSLTAFFRVSYRNNLHDVLSRTQFEDPTSAGRLDMAQAVFGWSPPQKEDGQDAVHNSWRGRVRVSFAELIKGTAKTQRVELPGIRPRPSFHPYYLAPTKGAKHPLDPDNGQAILAGRKRYPARDGISDVPEIANDAQKNEVDFLEPGQTFKAKIRLHNLRPAEAGALIWALTLGQIGEGTTADGTIAEQEDRGLRHMLGRGRNWGYGQVHFTLQEARIKDVLTEEPAELRALVSTFKQWVTTELEDDNDFDSLPEIRQLLGTCHAETGNKRIKDLIYPGQDRPGNTELFKDYKAIRDKTTKTENAGQPIPIDPTAPGFIGLPRYAEYDWNSPPRGEA